MPLSRAARENLLEPLKTIRVTGQPWPWSMTRQQSCGPERPEVLWALEMMAAQLVFRGLGWLSTVYTSGGLSRSQRWFQPILLKAVGGISLSLRFADEDPLGHDEVQDLSCDCAVSSRQKQDANPGSPVSEPEGRRKRPMEA